MYPRSRCVLTVLVLVLASVSRPSAEGGAVAPQGCARLWYTSTECECTDAKHATCACSACTTGPDCSCVAKIREGTGIVEGVLKHPYAKKYEGAVYLTDVPGGFKPPPYEPAMDQVKLVYTPHVLPVMVGTTVQFPNSDDVRHSVYTTPQSAGVFNLGSYPAGEVKRVKMDAQGVITLLCNVHAEMNGYIVVCPNPYFSATEKRTGNFRIPNVPPGKYRIMFFHEKLESQTLDVEVKPGETSRIEFNQLKTKA